MVWDVVGGGGRGPQGAIMVPDYTTGWGDAGLAPPSPPLLFVPHHFTVCVCVWAKRVLLVAGPPVVHRASPFCRADRPLPRGSLHHPPRVEGRGARRGCSAPCPNSDGTTNKTAPHRPAQLFLATWDGAVCTAQCQNAGMNGRVEGRGRRWRRLENSLCSAYTVTTQGTRGTTQSLAHQPYTGLAE